MGNEDSEEDCEENTSDAESASPDLQFPVLRPDGGKGSGAILFEEFLLDQSTCRVIGKRIGEQRLDDKDQVARHLEPAVDVVDDDLLGVLLPIQEGNVAKASLAEGGGDVTPVHHAMKLIFVNHVLLQRADEDLRGVAEHNDA